MKLVDKIKQQLKLNRLNDAEVETDLIDTSRLLFEQILEEIERFDTYKQEIESLQKIGHQHFIIKEVQDNIISIIDKDEAVLNFFDEKGRDVGKICAGAGLEDVVLRVMDNEEAMTRQDIHGQNLAMHCLDRKDMDRAIIKALKHPIVSTQQEFYAKRNLGMLTFLHRKPEEITMIALDNEVARRQVDEYGNNMGIYAVENGTENAMLKALKDPVACVQANKFGTNIGIAAAVKNLENVCMVALDNPKIATCQREKDRCNMGMILAKNKMEKCVLKALDNYEASTQQNINGENIGIIAAKNRLEEATMKALDNPEASIQQTRLDEYNIGMIAESKGMKKCVLKALDNPVAAAQVDFYAHNLLFMCATSGFVEGVLKGLDNKDARNNITGKKEFIDYFFYTFEGEDLERVKEKYYKLKRQDLIDLYIENGEDPAGITDQEIYGNDYEKYVNQNEMVE